MFKFYFWRKSLFYVRGKPSNKVNVVEEEQDGIDIARWYWKLNEFT